MITCVAARYCAQSAARHGFAHHGGHCFCGHVVTLSDVWGLDAFIAGCAKYRSIAWRITRETGAPVDCSALWVAAGSLTRTTSLQGWGLVIVDTSDGLSAKKNAPKEFIPRGLGVACSMTV